MTVRRFSPARRGGRRRWLALGLLLAACERPPAFDPPDIEGWTGEPQVAVKIRSAREQALAEPDSAAAAGRLGMTFYAHDLFAEAIPCFRRAAELDPSDPRWPYLTALAVSKNDLEQSLADFARAGELGLEHPGFRVAYGDVLARLGRGEEAEAQYRRALEREPGTSHALYGLGRLALGRGDAPAAAEHLERATRIAPWHGEVHTLLAQAYRRLGRAEEAELELLRAGAHPETSRTPDPILAEVEAQAVSLLAYRRRGRTLAENGRFAEAEAQLRRIFELGEGNARDYSNLGGALAGQGRLDEAVEVYRRALALEPDNALALNNLGMALADQGDLGAAVEQLGRAVELDPAYADAHRNLGLLLARQGRHREAISRYRLALGHDPSLAEAHTDLGTALANEGEMEQAMASWRRALAIDPLQLSALYNLAVALAGRGEHAEAVDWLRRGISFAPNSSRLASLLAWELATAPDAGLRDPARAERLARRVFDSYPQQPEAADVLAAALAAQGRFEEAIAVAQPAAARARGAGQQRLAQQLELRLAHYRRGEAFEQDPIGAGPSP